MIASSRRSKFAASFVFHPSSSTMSFLRRKLRWEIRHGLNLSLFLAGMLAFAGIAWAAACEAEVGEWAQFDQAPSAYEVSGMRELHFAGAKVFSGPHGIVNTEADPEALGGGFSAQAEWKDKLLEIKI